MGGASVDLGEICRYWARWQPEAAAVDCEGRALTWRELDRRTDAIAAGLAERGLGAGDRLGILGQNSTAWCELVVAGFKLGAAIVPLNIRLSPDELGYVIGHAGCAAVAVDADLAPRYDAIADRPGACLRLRLDGSAGEGPTVDELAAGRGEPPAPDLGDEAPALIAYTSGTTGRPKGAVLTQRNVLALIRLLGAAEGWNSATRTLLCVPLAFTGGIVNNFVATYGAGGTLVLERTFEPARALQLLVERRITALIGVPVMWQGIADVPGFDAADLSRLTTAITGGAPVPETLLRTYQRKGVLIRQAYGLTEATALVAMLPPELATGKPKAAGMPVLHTEVRLVDPEGRDCPTGETGEILVRGPQVMAGYWGDAEATARAIADGWLHTGDLGRLDGDGLLEIVDRKNDLIISGGLNVYPAEIERVLADFPGLAEAAVVGVPDGRWGEVPAAIVRSARPIDGAEVVAHCRRLLADYKTPRHVVVVDEPLPRSMSGKVLRRELRAKYQDLPTQER
ncbi:MAG TPA: AMP-binding protein [Acidimicrobiia bacterium]|nr:AMP-binding protein [Acidimicrobiia bacterium]